MEIISFIWGHYLYIPLFNLLIVLYLSWAGFNLGVAIILLTIITRIVLLPFTILTERGRMISQRLRRELAEVRKDYAGDPVLQKQKIRELLKRKKIRPWAKAVVLGIQGLVLLLLYQVFLGGINSQKNLQLLYPNIPRPDFINTQFLWFDISQQNLLLAALVAGFLFSLMLIEQWNERRQLSQGEVLFMIFFPASIFLVLAFLPASKSLFVLTSLVFSAIVALIAALIKLARKKADANQPPASANQGGQSNSKK